MGFAPRVATEDGADGVAPEEMEGEVGALGRVFAERRDEQRNVVRFPEQTEHRERAVAGLGVFPRERRAPGVVSRSRRSPKGAAGDDEEALVLSRLGHDLAEGDDRLARDRRRRVSRGAREGLHRIWLARAAGGRDGVPAQHRVGRVGLEDVPGQASVEAPERLERGDAQECVARGEHLDERPQRDLARLFACERGVSEGLGGADADVGVLVVERAHERGGAAAVGHPAEHLDRELSTVRVQTGEGGHRGGDRVRADRDQRLDRRVAKADVLGLLERGHEGRDDVFAPVERGRNQRALLANTPVVVAEGSQEKLGHLRAPHLGHLLDGDPPSLGLGLLQQPADGGGGLVHVCVLAAKPRPVPPRGGSDARAGAWAASRARSRKRVASSTKTSVSVVRRHAGDPARVFARAEVGGRPQLRAGRPEDARHRVDDERDQPAFRGSRGRRRGARGHG